MIRGLHKDVKKQLRQLRKRGFEVERTNGDHIRVRAPNGAVTHLASTPSRVSRAMRNLKTWANRQEN